MKKLLLLPLIAGLLFLSCDKKPSKPKSYRVKYEVTGTPQEVWVTLENASGGTEQHDIVPPWDFSFNANAGKWVYISATIAVSGNVTVKIYRNVKVLQEATATGKYSSATVSATI